jgi:phosphopantothenoylcysteine decarboxylase/phosphopantothenate--cysteine ligase
MDGHMYDAPATQHNLDLVRQHGYHILEPAHGYLASGLEGKGRLPELPTIVSKIEDLLATKTEKPAGNKQSKILAGKQVIVTAGPTREYLDPVRFISNPSSGKMGVAMAEAARDMGAEVTLIHGPLTTDLPADIHHIPITSAEELFEQIKQHSEGDIFILAAAVSDFAPADKQQQKVKKDQASTTLSLKSTPDSLVWLGKNKKDGQMIIGFAMESEKVIENARQKRKKKKADWIVANSIAAEEGGFSSDYNDVTVIGSDSEVSYKGSKQEVAELILRKVLLEQRR